MLTTLVQDRVKHFVCRLTAETHLWRWRAYDGLVGTSQYELLSHILYFPADTIPKWEGST